MRRIGITLSGLMGLALLLGSAGCAGTTGRDEVMPPGIVTTPRSTLPTGAQAFLAQIDERLVGQRAAEQRRILVQAACGIDQQLQAGHHGVASTASTAALDPATYDGLADRFNRRFSPQSADSHVPLIGAERQLCPHAVRSG